VCFCICYLFWFLAESLVPKKTWNQVTRWVRYDFAKKMDKLWHTMTNQVFEGTNRSIRDWTSRNSSYRGMKLGWRIHRFGLKTPHPKRNLAVWCRIFSLKMEDLHGKKPPCKKGSRRHGFPVPMTGLPAQFVWASGHSLRVDCGSTGRCFWPRLIWWFLFRHGRTPVATIMAVNLYQVTKTSKATGWFGLSSWIGNLYLGYILW